MAVVRAIGSYLSYLWRGVTKLGAISLVFSMVGNAHLTIMLGYAVGKPNLRNKSSVTSVISVAKTTTYF
ncbi:hypothetical protein NIES4071_97610 [Calothrix sp. NIES-4071]|nr:hypothetical protein NIES4071_97610 [Calothrix sp. NIES-4071]BAZ64025.1 hypothetical protein NIES4105_97540 [Calothrix sp. NIES-4105]